MNNQIVTQLRELKLGGMANALQTQLEHVGTYEGLSFMERLNLLLEQENINRQQRKQERLIRQARFKLSATLQDIDYQHPRNISRSQMAQLAQGDWISRAQNLLITGPCGSGKTYLAVPSVTASACTATVFVTTACRGCCWNSRRQRPTAATIKAYSGWQKSSC